MQTEVVKLGFVDEVEDKRWLLRHRFPSKLGGRPAWLHPVDLPFKEASDVRKPMLFLLQIYAPPPEQFAHEQAFHRSLYVFIADKGGDLSDGQDMVKAFRCQLGRENPWYGQSPPQDLPGDPLPPQLKQEDLTYVSRIDPWQVSRWEQSLDEHKFKPSCQLFTEYELIVDYENTNTQQQDVERLLEQYNRSELKDADVPEDILTTVENSTTPEQRQFAEFQARIEDAKEQVIRYCFSSQAEPLLPGTIGPPRQIPPCPICKGPRVFEFQIMPQAIHFLGKLDDYPNLPDWGAILVYSCQKSCNLAGQQSQDNCSSYAQEFVYVIPPP